EVEIDLVEVPDLVAGMLMFPWERVAEVLEAWRGWTATVPDEVTSSARVLQVPDVPFAPEPLRGRAFAVVEAACLLGEAEAEALLAPLRALGPEVDTFAPMPPAGLAGLH